MTKDDFVEIMFNSFAEDTLAMCKQYGMSDEDAHAKISESVQSLLFLISNSYDRLQEAGHLG